MRELLVVFQDVEDPRRGNAKRHDPHEMLALALAAMLAGGRTFDAREILVLHVRVIRGMCISVMF